MTESEKKRLFDIEKSLLLIEEFMEGSTSFFSYEKNKLLKSAVERQLTIIGEATNSLLKENPLIPLTHARRIVDFRNRIIHGYDTVDDAVVWGILQKQLPALKQEVDELLSK